MNTLSTNLYYDKNKYTQAIEKFDKFIQNCTVITPKCKPFADFQISTITCISNIGTKVNIQQFFEAIHSEDKDIIYTKYSHFIKGSQNKKKRKKKLKKHKHLITKVRCNNQLFSNQMSIGFKCDNPKHCHKNPISVKVFRNGRIQMTGCKNMNEIHIMYDKLYQKIYNANANHVQSSNNASNNPSILINESSNDSSIMINNPSIMINDSSNNPSVMINNPSVMINDSSNNSTNTLNNPSKTINDPSNNSTNDPSNTLNNQSIIVENICKFDPNQIQIEMINGTFYVNESLNLDQVLKMFLNNYTHEKVFIIQNKKSPLNLSIKQFGYFDTKKKKDKIPSVFIYNTGAINIIATKSDILYQTYDFIKNNLQKWWDKVVEKKIVYAVPMK